MGRMARRAPKLTLVSLDSKIDVTADRLDRKIEETAGRLDQKIDESAARLDQKIEDSVASLDQKIDRSHGHLQVLFKNLAGDVKKVIEVVEVLDGRVERHHDEDRAERRQLRDLITWGYRDLNGRMRRIEDHLKLPPDPLM